MEIQINNQNLDFTIERDETLGDVVKDLEAWLAGTDLVLYSVMHEDRELLSLPYEQWGSTPHSQVGILDVKVKHTRELTVLNLQTILEYLDMLKQGIETGDEKRLAELLSGFSALVESLQKHFPDSDAAIRTMTTLFHNTGAEQVSAWTGENKAQAHQLIDLVRAQVSFRLQELLDPKTALQTLSGALKTCIEEISEISVLLQTGKDRKAMDTMVRFSELSQSLVRVVASVFPAGGEVENPVLVGGMRLQDFYQELNSILSELLEAFEAKDSVLIGDLMEYEIAPRLQQLRSFLQELT
ncbi:MAG: hypothetical protein JSV89_14720 [Spirochaetaceae bacterium]|nr:MAG: hypothetical protein JSV89_14720 [Spirochaetaceae bacterium]